VTAVFEAIYTVTVSGGTGGGTYAVGATVNITAGTVPAGQRFKNWTTTSNGVRFVDATSLSTSFTMPENAVTVTANFEAIYMVTVSGGTGSGRYAADEIVRITAGTAPAGQMFKNWTTESSGVSFGNANSASTSFTMPGNEVKVTAVFGIVVERGTFTDNRDNTVYKKVTIGNQTWMAENLNYQPSSGNYWCSANCATYGKLYDWETAKTVCPTGWHLPSRDEWGALAKAAGGTGNYGTGGTAGNALKSTGGWSYGGNGADTYGFSALPGGYRNSDGDFDDAGNYGFWWTVAENGSDDAYRRSMYYDGDSVDEDDYYESCGFSVRCVKD